MADRGTSQLPHAQKPNNPFPFHRDLAISGLLFLFALVCFANTLSGDLLPSWDDDEYVINNPLIRDMSLSGLWQMWSQYYFYHYIPVTLMSYGLDYHLWGLNPLGYHLTNVLLHAVNGILVYALCCRLQGQRFVAALAAALLVVHPLQVESVAWISERKNVLSLFFFLLAMLAHIRSRQPDRASWMPGLAWGCYLLALLSKPIVVCGPVLFMAYDYYWAGYSGRRAIRASLPLLALSGFSVAMSILAHKDGEAVQHYWQNSPWLTAQLMLRVCWEYVVSIVAPVDLNIRYSYKLADVIQGRVQMALGLGALAGLGFVAWWQPFGRPLSRFGVLWIVAFMLPVANLIPFAIQRADRYFYFPGIMLLLLFSMGVYRLWQWLPAPHARQGLAAAMLLLFLPLIYLTVQQNRVWATSETVWQNHLKDYPDSLTGLIKLSIYYYHQKDYERAEATLRSMLKYKRRYPKTYQYLVKIAKETGRYEEAIHWYRELIELQPKEPLYYNNLGHQYATLGRDRDAIVQFRKALALQPQFTRARSNLARAALRLKDYAMAREALDILHQAHPQHPWVVSRLCTTTLALNEVSAAASLCQQAVRIRPRHSPSLRALAYVYLRQSQPEQALSWAQKAVAAAPGSKAGYHILSAVYTALGEPEKAARARSALQQQ